LKLRRLLKVAGATTAIVAVLTACSGSDGPPQTNADPTNPVPSVLSAPADSAEIVPADVTIGSVQIGEVATFAPDGWVYDEAVEGFSPPNPADWAPGTAWIIADRCVDAACERLSESQWETTTGVVFDEHVAESVSIERDEPFLGGRLVDASFGSSQRSVAVVRWVHGEARYLWCEVRGDDAEIDSLAVALEFACENTRASLN